MSRLPADRATTASLPRLRSRRSPATGSRPGSTTTRFTPARLISPDRTEPPSKVAPSVTSSSETVGRLSNEGQWLTITRTPERKPETDMSELLVAGLSKTKHELEAGISDAERELALTEEYCRKLEQLIAVGKATLHAATQANIQPTTPRTETSVPTSRVDPSSATHGETATESDNNGGSDLRKHLTAEAGKSTSAQSA